MKTYPDGARNGSFRIEKQLDSTPLELFWFDDFILAPECTTASVGGETKGGARLSITASLNEFFTFCSILNNRCTTEHDHRVNKINTMDNFDFMSTIQGRFDTQDSSIFRANLLAGGRSDIKTIFYEDRIVEFVRLYATFDPALSKCTFYGVYETVGDDSWMEVE